METTLSKEFMNADQKESIAPQQKVMYNKIV